MYSQLVDGVLRDDRVGREVGDHVGATEAAGAGGRRLPFASQRAQGHEAGSRLSGPHPGPGPARARGDRVGICPAGGADSAGSRRPNWDRRVARRQPPQPWGSAVESWRQGAASSPPQPASGAGRRLGRPSAPAGSIPPLRPAPEFVALTGSRCERRAWGDKGHPPKGRDLGEVVKRVGGGQERLSHFLGMFQQKGPFNRLYTLNLKQTPFFR